MLELWEDYIFGDAQYEINKRRQINLRRPENLPNEEDVNLIRETIISTMKNLTEDPFQQAFHEESRGNYIHSLQFAF